MWRTRCKGFSLVESLVAVVVLTTGLLGLARFQANLSRSALVLYSGADAQRFGMNLVEIARTPWLNQPATVTAALTPANGTGLTATRTTQRAGGLTVTQFTVSWAAPSAQRSLIINTSINNTLRPIDSRWLLPLP